MFKEVNKLAWEGLRAWEGIVRTQIGLVKSKGSNTCEVPGTVPGTYQVPIQWSLLLFLLPWPVSVYFINIYWVPTGHVSDLIRSRKNTVYLSPCAQGPLLHLAVSMNSLQWCSLSTGAGMGFSRSESRDPTLSSFHCDWSGLLFNPWDGLPLCHLWALFAVSSSPTRGSSPLLLSSVSAFGNPVHPSEPSSPPALTTKASWTTPPIFLWTTQAAVSAGNALNVWEPAGHGHWRVGVCPSCK